MKMDRLTMLFLIVAISLFALSCATSPPPVPEPEVEVVEPIPAEPEPVPEAVVVIPEPSEALAAVEKARAEALALEADKFYQEDWSSAESSFKESKALIGVDNQRALTALEGLLEQYLALVNKAKALAESDLVTAQAQAKASRTAAYELEAQRYFSATWDKAEADYLTAGKQASAAEAGELSAYREAVKTYQVAATAYDALVKLTQPVVLAGLAKAKARAGNSRKQAFDLNAASYRAIQWTSAEELYLSARSFEDEAVKGLTASYVKAGLKYQAAADAYDAIALETLPEFAENRRVEALLARERAIGAGIEGLYPNLLKIADAAALAVIDLYNQGDYYGAYNAWLAARDGYISLETGSKAYFTKDQIDQRNLGAYDRGNYTIGSQKLQESLEAFEAGKTMTAKDNAAEAVLRLGIALEKGREFYAVDRGKTADTERKAAVSLKANVAVKDDFEAANAVLAQADAAFQAKSFDEASDLYAQSELMFGKVGSVAAEKRAAAMQAMEAASRQMSESEQAAREADTVVSGGAK